MELLETEISSRLLVEDETYQQLTSEHRQYEERLEQVSSRRPFTEQDWFEEAVVKKRKLQLKDRMAAMVRSRMEAK